MPLSYGYRSNDTNLCSKKTSASPKKTNERSKCERSLRRPSPPWRTKGLMGTSALPAAADNLRNLTLASIFRRKKQEPLFDSGPEAFNLLMKEAVVKEFLDEQEINVLCISSQD